MQRQVLSQHKFWAMVGALVVSASGWADETDPLTASLDRRDWRMVFREWITSIPANSAVQFRVEALDSLGRDRIRIRVCRQTVKKVPFAEGSPEDLPWVAKVSMTTTVRSDPGSPPKIVREDPPPVEVVLADVNSGLRSVLNSLGLECVAFRRASDRFEFHRNPLSSPSCVDEQAKKIDEGIYLKGVRNLVRDAIQRHRSGLCRGRSSEDLMPFEVERLPSKQGRGFRIKLEARGIECAVGGEPPRQRSAPQLNVVYRQEPGISEESRNEIRKLAAQFLKAHERRSDSAIFLAGLPKRMSDLVSLVFLSSSEPLQNWFLVKQVNVAETVPTDQPDPDDTWLVDGSANPSSNCMTMELARSRDNPD